MIWGLRRKIGGRPPPPKWVPPRNQILASPLGARKFYFTVRLTSTTLTQGVISPVLFFSPN